MKSVLMSIQPKWCELIASGKKTVEVRKTKPNLETPFKVYIYCTQARKPIREDGRILLYEDDLAITNWWGRDKKIENPHGCLKEGELLLNGKVIGEFVCDCIQEYESEFVDDDCREAIASIDRDEDGDTMGFFEWTNESDIPYIKTDFFKRCCVGYEDLKRYIGLGFVTFYGWHISNLIIYDVSKELHNFYKSGFTTQEELADELCNYCAPTRYGEHSSYGTPNGIVMCEGRFCGEAYQEYLDENFSLTRPPQSWCYVEVV